MWFSLFCFVGLWIGDGKANQSELKSINCFQKIIFFESTFQFSLDFILPFPHIYFHISKDLLAILILGSFHPTFWRGNMESDPVLSTFSHRLAPFHCYFSLHGSFTNRCTFIKTLITIYFKIRWLLHVSVYDHHQGACNWAWLKLYWY